MLIRLSTRRINFFTLNHFALLIQFSLDKMHGLSMLALFQVRTDKLMIQYDTKAIKNHVKSICITCLTRRLPFIVSIHKLVVQRHFEHGWWTNFIFEIFSTWIWRVVINKNNNDNDNYFYYTGVIIKFIECLSV